MTYEAIILDTERGHFKRGVGQTPVVAITNAFRSILKYEVPDDREEEILDKIGPTQAMQTFLMVNTDDEFFENPKTIKEDVIDTMVLIRVNRTKETMYVPCGWVRPKF